MTPAGLIFRDWISCKKSYSTERQAAGSSEPAAFIVHCRAALKIFTSLLTERCGSGIMVVSYKKNGYISNQMREQNE